MFRRLNFNAKLTFILLGLQFSSGAVLYRSQDELPRGVEYDFIIAGGGTAGSVVASRLGENPNWNILVVEAGTSNEEVFNTRVPGLWYTLMHSSVDWNYTVVPQKGLDGKSLVYTRAKMLGGCSSHNTMVYTRGSRDDWDSWANMTGADGLQWDKMLPYILKAEQWSIDPQNRTQVNHYNTSVHSKDGKVSVSLPYTVHPFNDMLLQSTKEMSEEFPFDLDMNDGKPLGIGWKQSTVDHNGERSSAATAYLNKTLDNVHVLINTYVTRVIQNNGTENTWAVEFAVGPDSKRQTLIAKKEVIVSGGAIGTPHILLNSGIGSSEELKAVGVETVLDLPSVGKNLSDHIATPTTFSTTFKSTGFNQTEALEQWQTNRTGPLTQPQELNHIGFTRIPTNSTGFEDPAPGMNTPHIEFAFGQISQQDGSTETSLELFVVNLHPISRGSVTLNTSNPFTYPIVDFGLLTSQTDLTILRQGILSARRLFSAPVFTSKKTISGTSAPGSNITSDGDLEAYIRQTGTPLLHAVGTAAMSPRNATWGVVDPDFRVKGVKGVRVVDASVIPNTPSGHTQAPVYGIAEWASALIVADWNMTVTNATTGTRGGEKP
ncbi:Glucose dehydrogenase [FAD, quinone] [Leucoagaricus sp. SymC.cos]|nr:Glucose dehydrogenase [FAD, quinone] [Leucoagaricus sp. SymC.cos]